MSATQKEIAAALKISSITVHRALNNSGYVSNRLKEKILRYAKKVNYVPHKASQVLVRNRIRKIAVFSSREPTFFWNDIKTGIDIAADQIRPFDYDVRYCMIPEHDSRGYLGALRHAIQDGAEAIALVNQRMYTMDEIFRLLEVKGIPYITLNVDAPASKRICYVGPDYPAGGRLAAEFIGKTLMFRKNSRVLVISREAEITCDSVPPDINRLRFDGFQAVMKRDFSMTDFEVRLVRSRSCQHGIESELKLAMASAGGDLDAIYLIPPFNAQLVRVLEARQTAAKMVVVVHDMDPFTDHYFQNKLVTGVIYQNPILQGYYAVKILENLLESGRPPAQDQITIVHSLVLSENRDLFRNHYLFTRMMSDAVE